MTARSRARGVRAVAAPGGSGPPRGGMVGAAGALGLWALGGAGAAAWGWAGLPGARGALGELPPGEAAALRAACAEAGPAAAPFRRAASCRFGPAGRAPAPSLRPAERAGLLFGAVMFVLPRIIVTISLLAFHTLVCVLCGWGLLGRWGLRTVAPASGSYTSLLLLWGCGMRLAVERRGDSRKPAAVVVSNHTSYLDIFVLTYLYFPGFVSKAAVADVPLIGTSAKAMGSVFVERTADTKRAGAGQKHGQGSVLQDRIREVDGLMRADPTGPHKPVAVFAEGTTSNGEYLLPFKRGAFLASVPVRPLVVVYEGGQLAAAWESMSALRHMFLLFSGFSRHTIKVIELPVIRPNSQERADPALFAERVRQAVGAAGGFKYSASTLKEKREYEKVMKGEMRAIKQKRKAGDGKNDKAA